MRPKHELKDLIKKSEDKVLSEKILLRRLSHRRRSRGEKPIRLVKAETKAKQEKKFPPHK